MIKAQVKQQFQCTPLRYPGGKTSLTGFFQDVIRTHNWSDLTYIEPYAGGAGAALALLIHGKVKKIVINDYDPAIYAFWKSVTEHPIAFNRRIKNVPLTVYEWRRQKAIYKKQDLRKPFELGFATFYLNRTNRSGVLEAGPIGGMNQTGTWKIGARFNRESLIAKVKQIAKVRNKIMVLKEDGVDVIRRFAKEQDVLFYIDPPYYDKGAMLYLNAFDHQKHQELANVLNSYPKSKWLLSYDAVDDIKGMYIPQGRKFDTFSLRYSVHHNTKSGSELMIFSDSINTAYL